jgi:hypothetical protein
MIVPHLLLLLQSNTIACIVGALLMLLQSIACNHLRLRESGIYIFVVRQLCVFLLLLLLHAKRGPSSNHRSMRNGFVRNGFVLNGFVRNGFVGDALRDVLVAAVSK